MTFRNFLRSSAILAVLAATAALPATQTRRAMTVDDTINLVQLSAPRISPDGTRVLYVVSELGKWKDNKRVTSVWLANADGSGARKFLTQERDRDATWSPDGRYVAFLASRGAAADADNKGGGDNPPQIWIIRSDGGEATKLTDHKGTIRAFEWTRDSASIVFSAEHARSDHQKSLEKSGDDAIFVDEGANGQERGDFSGLWRIGLDDKTEHTITTDETLLIENFKVSPDATRIAVVFRRENSRNGQYHAEVGVVDAATGALTTITHNNAPEQNVQWSPDGKTLSFLAPSDTSWDLAEEKLWLVPSGGGAPTRLLNNFSGALRQYSWAPDGHSIIFGAQTRARGAVYRVAVPGGAVSRLAGGDWSGMMESVSSDASKGAAVVSSPGNAAEVNVVDLTSGTLKPVTHANSAFDALALSQFKAVTWKSRDGLEIEGLLWLPADYRPGTKLPLILSVHGGPAGAWDVSFRAINHVFTGLGWAVLEPNVRGSSSYGDALLRGNMKDIGGGDYFDLMTGVDKLVADGIADPDHLAIRGWSYGGILGGWTITQTTRFKAASLGAMVADWSSEYAMGFNHDVRLWYIGGTPWESAERYRQQSSYSHIASVTTPTLLLHGERDTTDTIGQSMIYYQGLKDRGVPVRFLRFPREPHGFREPHHIRIRDTEEIAWLMKYGRGIDWKAPERKDADAAPASKTSEP
ncbi:MAG TPA: S9 family peptidase [Vicinamibacterales bacterium]|jgi:dipeptidyl aminopeptidase/acylaminoacyl peptidase